jgi:hypothetical protein
MGYFTVQERLAPCTNNFFIITIFTITDPGKPLNDVAQETSAMILFKKFVQNIALEKTWRKVVLLLYNRFRKAR